MSEQLVIEPAKFARNRGRLTGVLRLSGLPRVVEQLADNGGPLGRSDDAGEQGGAGGGELHYVVEGYVTPRGYPALHLSVEGDVPMRCQRCLGNLPFALHALRDIVLVPGADEFAQADDENESEDTIPEAARLDLMALLEDEVLLGLPLAPCHEEGACELEDSAGKAASERVSPFAVLATLKQ